MRWLMGTIFGRAVGSVAAAVIAAMVSSAAITSTFAQSPNSDASSYPSRRIQLVLPYPGGGIVDIVARVVVDKMSENWHQSIVVEPKPGANGNIAWDQVSRAEPDGYTWTFFSPGTIVNPHIQSGLRWSEKDFVLIGAAVWAPSVVVVHPDLPVTTMAEFIAYVHKHPRELNWANPGVGTSQHINTAILIQGTQLDMVEVAYKGQPPGIIDLLANRVQMKVASIGLVSEHIKAGKLKPLAVIGKSRSPLLPDVPTLTEAGYPEINVVAWYGFAAPRATPRPIVDKIVAGFNAALKDAKVRTTLEAQGMQIVEPMTADELAALAASDTERFVKIIKDANIKISP